MIQKHLRPSIQMCIIIVFVILTVNPEEFQIEDVLNIKPYWQHLELIQIKRYCKAD